MKRNQDVKKKIIKQGRKKAEIASRMGWALAAAGSRSCSRAIWLASALTYLQHKCHARISANSIHLTYSCVSKSNILLASQKAKSAEKALDLFG
jgi:hypothetical protein